MAGFWNVLPHGEGFALYGAEHLAWLGFFAVFAAGACLFCRRGGARAGRAWDIAVASALIALQALRLAVIAAQGAMDVYFLPLHFCSLAVFIEAAYALRGNRNAPVWGDVLYAACMPGAAMALLFPDWTDYPAACFLSANSFIIHTLLVAYPLTLVVSGRIRPRPQNIPRVFLFLLCLALPVYFFDRALGVNYMFLNWPSPGSPLEWFAFLGRPGYLFGYLPVAAMLWGLLYLPWAALPPESSGQ